MKALSAVLLQSIRTPSDNYISTIVFCWVFFHVQLKLMLKNCILILCVSINYTLHPANIYMFKVNNRNTTWSCTLFLSSWLRQIIIGLLAFYMKKQPLADVFKKDAIKSFSIVTGKHLRSSLFLIKVQVFKLAISLKRNSNTGVFKWICEIFQISFFIEKSSNKFFADTLNVSPEKHPL